jgi:hypothetical protein
MLVLLGCSGARVAQPAARAAVARAPEPERASELAVAEPYRPPPKPKPQPARPPRPWLGRWTLLDDPGMQSLMERRAPREYVILVEGGALWLERGDRAGVAVAESQFWDPCVRELVAAQPAPARRALTAALARYQTACEPDGRVALLGALGVDGRRRRGSGVGLTATLSGSRTDSSLRVAYCAAPGVAGAGAERVVISGGGTRWVSPRLSFERDGQGCEAAELPLTRSLVQVLRAMIDATDAAVALEGGGEGPGAGAVGQDLAVTDEVKQDLRVLLDALDALAAGP